MKLAYDFWLEALITDIFKMGKTATDFCPFFYSKAPSY